MANGITISQLSPQGVKIIFSGNQITTSSSNFSFSTPLNSGQYSQVISYQTTLSNIPSSINCTLNNDIDHYSYIFSISNITTSNFQINFSDYLKSTGYVLLTEVDV